MKKFEELLKEDPNSKDEILKDMHAKLDALKKAKDEYMEKYDKEYNRIMDEGRRKYTNIRKKE
jgi:hypothetical protein